MSEEAKSLIDQMLVVDPDERLDAKVGFNLLSCLLVDWKLLQQVLEHPWLHGADVHYTKEELSNMPQLKHVGSNLYEHKDMIKAKFKASVSAILAINRSKNLVAIKRK